MLWIAGGLAATLLAVFVSLSAQPPAALAPVAAGPELAELAPECEIQGLAEYAIAELQVGACSPSVYVRSCREAQRIHRERCREFCIALKDLAGRRPCAGSSSPLAQLFDPDRHCRELRHEQFEVSCEVRAACACSAGGGGEG